MKEELQIQETQKISLDILKKIATICEEQDLRYYLFYGTLIGAVRHKGYIPWDDDVDIMMPREDHDKLIAYLQKHSSEYEHLEIFNHEVNEKYPYMITRISDDRYRIIMKNEEEYGMGVFLDIYPFDGLGNTEEEALQFGLKGDRLSSLCYQATRKRYAIETTTSKLRIILKFPVFLFAKLCGKNHFQNKLQKLVKVKDYDLNKYVGCVVWLSGGIKDVFERDWMEPHVMMEYEDTQFRAPKEYDKLLRKVYGDYMQLPPEKDRVGHHEYKVVRK